MKMKKTVITLLAVTALQISMVSAASASITLTAGQGLPQGSSLTSGDGRFSLAMQTDGNLVEYMGGTPLWSTGTGGVVVKVKDPDFNWYDYYTPYKLTLSSNGVLSLEDSGNNWTFWTANTQAWINNNYHAGMIYPTYGDTLYVQDDGNVVLYDTHSSSTWLAVWATNTGGH